MPSAQTNCSRARLLTMIALGTILTGCSTFSNPEISFGSRIGLRPDDPAFTITATDPCEELKRYMEYAVDLKEAYRTRATQNRTWIYVAGITGLGVAAASGALAAASAAAAGTLALLAISGGFTAGVFATIDNAELASVYTVAANDIGVALAYSQGRIARCRGSQTECSAELAYLTDRVTSARNLLETARTASAAGALARATAQKKLLDDEIAKVQAQVDKQARIKDAVEKEKDAAEKKDAAAAAKVEAQAKKTEAAAAQTNAANAPPGPAKQDAEKRADDAVRAAEVAEKNAGEADKQAKVAEAKANLAAEAKAKAEAEARAAATGPPSPACMTP